MIKSNSKYVNYGCGLSAPKEWINFDVSPTLRLQNTPIIGSLLSKSLNVSFPENVKYGNIISGLPIEDDSCNGVYCSHTLEHLALEDFRVALRNTLKILKPNAIFRCVVPDLEYAARTYLKDLEAGNRIANYEFIKENLHFGLEQKPKGFKGFLSTLLGNSHHLWMWDSESLSKELEDAGFKAIRKCNFNDCEDKMFNIIEERSRFQNAVAIECRK